MARSYAKCGGCGDILWFADIDAPPQSVICPCGETELTEEGAQGNPVSLTPEEIADIP